MGQKEKSEYIKLKETRFEPVKGVVFFGNKQDLRKIARDIIDECEKFLKTC